MTWKGAPGNVIAVGARGIYSIQSLTSGLHMLQGVGHDELPMPSLPSLGQGFISLDKAKTHAETLERTPLAETHAGGE